MKKILIGLMAALSASVILAGCGAETTPQPEDTVPVYSDTESEASTPETSSSEADAEPVSSEATQDDTSNLVSSGYSTHIAAVEAYMDAIVQKDAKRMVSMYAEEGVVYLAAQGNDTPEEYCSFMENTWQNLFDDGTLQLTGYDIVNEKVLSGYDDMSSYFRGYEPDNAYRVEVRCHKAGGSFSFYVYAVQYDGGGWYITETC